MKTQTISATALIESPAKIVYAIIADYREGHPSILPKKYFGALDVLQGGVGTGTQIRFEMFAAGSKRTAMADITEPEPGHVILETNYDVAKPNLKNKTTFTIDPVNGGKHAQVTIASEIQVTNWLEGIFVKMFLRGVYADELKQLGEVAGRQVK